MRDKFIAKGKNFKNSVCCVNVSHKTNICRLKQSIIELCSFSRSFFAQHKDLKNDTNDSNAKWSNMWLLNVKGLCKNEHILWYFPMIMWKKCHFHFEMFGMRTKRDAIHFMLMTFYVGATVYRYVHTASEYLTFQVASNTNAHT